MRSEVDLQAEATGKGNKSAKSARKATSGRVNVAIAQLATAGNPESAYANPPILSQSKSGAFITCAFCNHFTTFGIMVDQLNGKAAFEFHYPRYKRTKEFPLV